MSDDWKQMCRGSGLKYSGDTIEVRFDSGRRQKVAVTDGGDSFLLSSVVMRRAEAEAIDGLSEKAWLRNRTIRLVGFRFDGRGRLLGEIWVPKAGLTDDEFQTYIQTVAAECDRFEYQLTGHDAD
jgi:hypothetical protein